MTKQITHKGDAERAAIQAKLANIQKAVTMQKSEVLLLIEAEAALRKADAFEAVINKGLSLGLDAELMDPILEKSAGLPTADLVKAVGAYRTIAARSLRSAQQIGDTIDKLIEAD